ncbi:MAG: GtrA family protein [Micromonosporaceae bacterium]|nr:GtrA family protein [Micromonosporaceae bacterium]
MVLLLSGEFHSSLCRGATTGQPGWLVNQSTTTTFPPVSCAWQRELPGQTAGSRKICRERSHSAPRPRQARYAPCVSVTVESLPRRLWLRFGELVHEFSKFGVVGVVAYVVDVSISNLLLHPIGPIFSAVASVTVAATVAFIGNRFWTWRDRERTSLRREYLLYFLFNLGGLLIALACVGLSWYVFGHFWPSVFQNRLAYNIAKNVVGLILGTLFRFWSYRRFVFVARTP